MRGDSVSLLCLRALAPLGAAQTFDRIKFRQAIEMPAVSAQFSISLKAHERDPKGNKIDPAQKIAELQKKLTGSPDDALVYLDQRDVYLAALGDVKKADELIRKAEAVLRPHTQTKDPKQA